MIGSSLITDGWAQRRSSTKRTPATVLVMPSQTQGSLSVSFVSAVDGAPLTGASSSQRTLDLGRVSRDRGAFNSSVNITRLATGFVVSTRFGLTVHGGSGQDGSATILAGLAVPDPAFVFRLDGLRLSATPQIIQGQARLGSAMTHRLEIEVPASVTEKNSQLHNAILFQVIAN